MIIAKCNLRGDKTKNIKKNEFSVIISLDRGQHTESIDTKFETFELIFIIKKLKKESKQMCHAPFFLTADFWMLFFKIYMQNFSVFINFK